MKANEYKELIEELTDHRNNISKGKREDYTKGDPDVLKNFKGVGESSGLRPLQVWLVYFLKHIDAISSYVKSDGQSESEPIKERFSDALNYLELGYAIIEEDLAVLPTHITDSTYCTNPDICTHPSCNC